MQVIEVGGMCDSGCLYIYIYKLNLVCDALITLIFCVYSGLQTIMLLSSGPYLIVA